MIHQFLYFCHWFCSMILNCSYYAAMNMWRAPIGRCVQRYLVAGCQFVIFQSKVIEVLTNRLGGGN